MKSVLKPGDLGTSCGVNDLGDVIASWDKGGSLRVMFGKDEVKKYEVN